MYEAQGWQLLIVQCMPQKQNIGPQKAGRSYLVQGQISMLSYMEHRTTGQDRRGISAFVHPLMAGRAALCKNRVRTL